MQISARKWTKCTIVISLFVTSTEFAVAQHKVHREDVSFTAATMTDGGAAVRGELRFPDGGHEKFPAVVVIHNAGGLADRTGTDYVEALNQAGIATLELDLFPRGARPQSTRSTLPHTYGSLIFLAKHPRIDPQRIGVMGFSFGGIMSMYSASEELTQAYTGGRYRFAAHLPLYPVCWLHARTLEGKGVSFPASVYRVLTGAPVHILAGEKDDYDDPDTCPMFVRDLPEAARRNVSVTVYPGAYHGWDTRENRQYQDRIAHKGRGGYVSHSRSSDIAEQSRKFAVEFFRKYLAVK